MEYFKFEKLVKVDNRHLVSEVHIRVQVLTITQSAWENSDRLYDKHHGEVLLIALEGKGIVNTESETLGFFQGDQVLIHNGEPFNVLPDCGADKIRVQFIWTPGLNPCQECWELNSKFFKEGDREPAGELDVS